MHAADIHLDQAFRSVADSLALHESRLAQMLEPIMAKRT